MNSLNDIKIQASMAVARTGIDYVVVSVNNGFRFIPEQRYAGNYELLLKKDKTKVNVYNNNGKKIDSIETRAKKIKSSEKKGEPKDPGSGEDSGMQLSEEV